MKGKKMDHHFKVLAWIEKYWSSYKQNQPFKVREGNRNGFAVAFKAETLRVFIGILRGPRGGVTGEFVVVDDSQQILVDKLLCVASGSTEPFLVDGMKGHYNDFDEHCPRHLIEMMNQFVKDPGRIKTRALMVGFTESSVMTVCGGAPSLGKRR